MRFYEQTKVKHLKEEFKKHFQGTLRVYKANRRADDDATLASICSKDNFENFEFNMDPEITVAQFQEEMLTEYGIKVKVASLHDWIQSPEYLKMSQLKELYDGESFITLKDMFPSEEMNDL